MENSELQFPVVAHHRIIINAGSCDVTILKSLFTDFELTEPIMSTHTSAGGRYAAFGLSVRLADRAEMERFDAQLRLIPGLKMVL